MSYLCVIKKNPKKQPVLSTWTSKIILDYLACQQFPCVDEQDHWQWTKLILSFLPLLLYTCSGNQRVIHARDSLTLTTAESMYHCLENKTGMNTTQTTNKQYIPLLYNAYEVQITVCK